LAIKLLNYNAKNYLGLFCPEWLRYTVLGNRSTYSTNLTSCWVEKQHSALNRW